MSHFYGSLIGSRGKTTRCGTAYSGIQAHVHGWHVGAQVQVRRIEGDDVVFVWATSGSDGSVEKLLYTFRESDLPFLIPTTLMP